MFDTLRQDLQRAAHLSTSENLPGTSSSLRGRLAVAVYRFGRYARECRIPLIGLLFKVLYYFLFYFVQMFTGISIQAYARIGPGLVIRNPGCVFVLAESIGSNFTVSEGVTIGNIRGKSRLAIIGDNVYLEPGCKILGDVTIGNNVVVRANSLVLGDIPDNSMAVGNPARITKMDA
jgi:serine O-acetyltransferase